MPLVRLELPASVTDAEARAISGVVHNALVEHFQVPPDDRFQVIARHPEGSLVITPEYLGVKLSPRAFIVTVNCSPGRTLQAKRALYAAIANGVQAATGIPAADAIIVLVETLRENWSFGEGVAHYTL